MSAKIRSEKYERLKNMKGGMITFYLKSGKSMRSQLIEVGEDCCSGKELFVIKERFGNESYLIAELEEFVLA